MFRRLSEPLPLSEASLLLLRPAMNAPVLNVGFLPVGPARAAAVAFAEEYGGIGIALGIRSNESGQLVVIRNQESIDFDVALVDALEPLLAEAERMGFLFDEDMLAARPGQRGRAEAMVHWAVLMGGMEGLLPSRYRVAAARADADAADAAGPLSPSLAVAESQYPELLLDDVAPLELAVDTLSDAPEDETFEEDLSPAPPPGFRAELEADLDADLEDDLDASLENVLDEVLDEALAGGLDDDLQADFGTGLAPDDSDSDIANPLLSDLDLTEPTAPIVTARPGPNPTAPTPFAAAESPEPSSPARGRSARLPPPPGPPARVVPTAPPGPPPVVLSKFRQAGTHPTAAGRVARSAEVGSDGASELARIPIVRVRREVEKKTPFLARLLSSF